MADRPEDVRVCWTTQAMAGLAAVALDQAVLEPGRSRAVALAGTVAVLIAPMLAVGRWLGSTRQAGAGRSRAAHDRRGGLVQAVSNPAAALLSVFALPFVGAAARFAAGGRGALVELLLMAALRNLGLGLAAMAHRRVYARLSAVVSLFLVTMASSVGGDAGPAVLAPIGGFAVAGTLWLMLVYWTALGLGSGAGPASRRLPLAGAAWVLGIVGMLAAVAAVGPSRAATALAGLVPTSGGTDWSDPDARSGVGDGDHEVSASEHPESVGFTESDVYLETDRPSLYDAFNESYGKPFKPKNQEKMIALGQQDVGEQKERPAENLQAGREFSALRRKPQPRPRRPGERAARALVYVKGPTPLHLPLTAYSHFDGTVWHEEPCCHQHFPAQPEPRGTWLKLPRSEAPFLAGIVAHQVKIGTLESSPMPIPPHPTRFRVGSVNRLDFFGWAQFGIIRMTDRTVPAGTVIDSEARTVDPEGLRLTPLLRQPGNEDDHNISFRDDYRIDPTVAALARNWVADRPEGWYQVEAVIAALKQGFDHDRSAAAPAGCTDVVAEFLLRSRRGPDYLFASAAAVLLRSLGYPTRVVSGLYAAPGRYDPRTRHTPVTRDDVHFWAEVRLLNGTWVAIEPTPGYELLPPVRPWSEQFARALWAVGNWARSHALGILATVLSFVVIVIRRHDVLDRVATLGFALFGRHDLRRYVMRALKLIECRSRWAGRARPPGITPARWYYPLASDGAGDARSALEGLIRLAGWATHAPTRSGLPAFAGTHEIRQICRSAVRAWTLARFRQALASRPGTAA